MELVDKGARVKRVVLAPNSSAAASCTPPSPRPWACEAMLLGRATMKGLLSGWRKVTTSFRSAKSHEAIAECSWQNRLM